MGGGHLAAPTDKFVYVCTIGQDGWNSINKTKTVSGYNSYLIGIGYADANYDKSTITVSKGLVSKVMTDKGDPIYHAYNGGYNINGQIPGPLWCIVNCGTGNVDITIVNSNAYYSYVFLVFGIK